MSKRNLKKFRKDRRYSMGEIWENLSTRDREFLIRFINRIDGHRNATMGVLALMSTGTIFDMLKTYGFWSQQQTKERVRTILRAAITRTRQAEYYAIKQAEEERKKAWQPHEQDKAPLGRRAAKPSR